MAVPINTTVIQISNLTIKFADLTAVDGISFEIRKGEIFGLLGPNGAGKTTTINMICGLLPLTAGEIVFKSVDVSSVDARTHIGVCPQDNVFWPKLKKITKIIHVYYKLVKILAVLIELTDSYK